MKKIFTRLVLCCVPFFVCASCALFTPGPEYIFIDLRALASADYNNNKPYTAFITIGDNLKSSKISALEKQAHYKLLKTALQFKNITVIEDSSKADLNIVYDIYIKSEKYTVVHPGYISSDSTVWMSHHSRGVGTYVSDSVVYPSYKSKETRFVRNMSIIAKYNHTNKEAWELAAISVGYSSNLRFIATLMLAGSIPYMGTTTGININDVVVEDSKMFKQLTELSFPGASLSEPSNTEK